jgi:DNA polymerase elongation subunit (family B)
MGVDKNKIKEFLKGRDPQERIVSIECGYGDTYVSVFSRNSAKDGGKIVLNNSHPFKPFVWAKLKVLIELEERYGGPDKFIEILNNFGIIWSALECKNSSGYAPKRMTNGYNIIFEAQRPMSYSTFSGFFKRKLGMDIYDKKKNFMAITPVEQFMIQTGKRYFKGFNEYDDLLRCVWDIETTGLDPNYCSITQIGISTNRGYENIIHVEGNTEEEKKQSEKKTIQKFFKTIEGLNPDILAGHNSEVFDWPFILRRIEILWPNEKESLFNKIINFYWGDGSYNGCINTSLGDGKYNRCYYRKDKDSAKEVLVNKTLYKKDNKTVLKLGGETEYFYQTIWYGHTTADSLHACRRAQAIDSNMKSGNLKYAAEFAKQKKQNRVYIPGEKISEIYYDPSEFILDESNGEWRKLKPGEDFIPTDTTKSVTGKYIADRYLLDDLYEGDRVEWYYNQSSFFLSKMLPIPYQKVLTMGTSATWKYILLAWSYENGLAIPAFDELKVFPGGLARLLKVGLVKDIVKLDFNSLYPAITLTDGVFPELDISGVFEALLDEVLTEREKFKGLKAEFGKKAKETDNPDEKLKFEQEEARNDKLQLPFKIFGNSFFGSYGAPNIFNWGDVNKAGQITCIARQCFRLLVKWFGDRGFVAIVGDTDGVNFSYSDIYKDYKYIGKGLNRNTKEGVEYIGIEAYVAEFNDLFMRNKMGLGIDEYAPATINFSRKNYADLLKNGKIKYVGNSIKSKKMPKYIEKFLETNIKLLLYEDGYTFLKNYNEYISKIYNYQIPLRDIASIGSIKITLDEYKVKSSGKTKSGGDKAKQAWYELALQNNIKTHPGDKIYYVNIGVKKSEGDVIKENIYEYDADGNIVMVDRVDKKTGEIVYSKRGDGNPLKDKKVIGNIPRLNCVRIDPSVIEAEIDYYGHEDIFGDKPIQYNAAKYINQFNNRIKALLVCFHPDIRNKILVDSPEKVNVFTHEEAKLTSGYPNKEIDQDTLEALLTMEDKEIKFWTDNDLTPPYLDEVGINWEETKADYFHRQEELKKTGIKDELEKLKGIIEKITKEDIDDFFELEESSIDKLWYFKEIMVFCTINVNQEFISKKYEVKLGILSDIIDKTFDNLTDDDDETNTVENKVISIDDTKNEYACYQYQESDENTNYYFPQFI